MNNWHITLNVSHNDVLLKVIIQIDRANTLIDRANTRIELIHNTEIPLNYV